jgi:hypothetical protein
MADIEQRPEWLLRDVEFLELDREACMLVNKTRSHGRKLVLTRKIVPQTVTDKYLAFYKVSYELLNLAESRRVGWCDRPDEHQTNSIADWNSRERR